jgi:peptidoglycan/xylan/chitin deacetylase (PgdA/CDA1 family)
VGVPIVLLIAGGYFIPTSPVFGKVYYKGNCPEKVVALTFDDGPNEPYTSEILDLLASYNVKATFFVIGENVELYPETAKRIVAEGHVLGNHSYSHNANHALTGYGAKDLTMAEEAIVNTVGVSPHLYRPPHGKKSPWELEKIKEQGLVEVTWSDSANELSGASASSLAQEIVKKTKPGEIILLHDGYGTSHDSSKSDKSLTVEVLPLIIKELQAQGYRFVTVPELLSIPAYND